MWNLHLPKIKVTGQINVLEHLDIALFVRMMHTDTVVRNVDHACILYLVDCVIANISHTSPLGHQDDVVPFKKLHKACIQIHQRQVNIPTCI